MWFEEQKNRPMSRTNCSTLQSSSGVCSEIRTLATSVWIRQGHPECNIMENDHYGTRSVMV